MSIRFSSISCQSNSVILFARDFCKNGYWDVSLDGVPFSPLKVSCRVSNTPKYKNQGTLESFGENGENFTIVSVVFEQIVKKMSPFKAQFNLGSILSYLVKATVLPLDYVSVVLFKSRQCFSSTDVTMQSKLEHFVDEQFHTIFIHLMVVLHCN